MRLRSGRKRCPDPGANDQLISARFDSESKIQIAAVLSKPGVYTLVVVQPGSGGGVSDTFYLIVGS